MGAWSDIPPRWLREPFLVRDALAAGVSPRVLRGSRFRTPFRGVRVPVHLGDALEVDCQALALLQPGAAFSGLTALRLCRVPVPDRAPRLQVSSPPSGPAVRLPGVAARRDLDRAAVRCLPNGLRVVGPLESWVRLGDQLDLDDLVVAGDALVRRGWSDLARLREASAETQRINGVRRVREAATMVRAGVDSPPETRLRLAVVRAGLPEPQLGWTVRDEFGAQAGRPDLAWPLQRVAVEYDGIHHLDAGQWRHDVVRKRGMESLGWRVYVATALDLRSGFRDCVRWLGRELALTR